RRIDGAAGLESDLVQDDHMIGQWQRISVSTVQYAPGNSEALSEALGRNAQGDDHRWHKRITE
ncbi:MAG: hypothetical protein JSW71_22260, partial [Gemmatimonadota bacterium]